MKSNKLEKELIATLEREAAIAELIEAVKGIQRIPRFVFHGNLWDILASAIAKVEKLS